MRDFLTVSLSGLFGEKRPSMNALSVPPLFCAPPWYVLHATTTPPPLCFLPQFTFFPVNCFLHPLSLSLSASSLSCCFPFCPLLILPYSSLLSFPFILLSCPLLPHLPIPPPPANQSVLLSLATPFALPLHSVLLYLCLIIP